jgi:ribonucleases P/MRP protein subunit RPP40
MTGQLHLTIQIQLTSFILIFAARLTVLLLVWLSAFITGRSQCVVVDNVHSSYVDVISGVPKGSVLGPILFVNDIDTVCHSSTKLKLYTDDLKLYSVVKSVSSLGYSDLQKSLDNLSHWAISWQFSINTTKTTVLNLSNTMSFTTVKTYSIDDAVLFHSSIVSDLGILTDGRLLFKDHINSIVAKSSQPSGAIFRGFVSRTPSLMHKAFITHVRPILEYISCIWNPSHKHLIDTIENVQRRYTNEFHTYPVFLTLNVLLLSILTPWNLGALLQNPTQLNSSCLGRLL